MLPPVQSPSAFDDMLRRPSQWDAAIAHIRQRHNIAGPFEQSRTGSTVVFVSAEHCIKLSPPLAGFVAAHRREVAALEYLAGRLPIRTPELVAMGQVDTWNYFISTRLPGTPIDARWGDLPAATRAKLVTQLGESIRAMHELSGDPVAEVTQEWSSFRKSQRARCAEQEESKGLPAARLAELERYLELLDRIPEPRQHSSLLHTEIGPSHALVDGGRVSGLIDFGDTMVGDPEYDLAPVGMFLTRGDAAAFRAFSVAYGLGPAELQDPQRPTRLMRHALLHRYGTLAWYLDELSPPRGTLDELAAHWFAVG